MDLRNAKVLVTGGSLGIGKATAKLLVENGAKVAVTARNGERLRQAAEEIGAFPIQGDVSKHADVKRTYVQFLEEFGSLDCLVNNAGIGRGRPLVDITEETMRMIWEVNVLGATLMAQKAAQLFVEQKSGNIVNIASTAAHRGYKNGSAYCSTKFALKGLSECWRAELRPHNVRVITICPSEVTTAFGNEQGIERNEQANRLRSVEIAHAVKAALEMDDRGFIPELTVFATNPW